MLRSAACYLGVVLLCWTADTAVLNAQPTTIRLGSEFQANLYTMGSQRLPALAQRADGSFMLVWHSVQDGSSYGIFSRRFDTAGVPQAAEFQVNTYTLSEQKYPKLAVDADGDFVVAWQSLGQDGSGNGVFARRFNAAGAPQAGEFQVNTYTTEDQASTAVAMDSDGDFVVTWHSDTPDGFSDIIARRFNAAGAPQTNQILINTYTTSIQSNAAIAMDADGDFVVAWNSAGNQDGFAYGVFGRRINAAGSPQGAEFQVNSYTTGSQSSVDLAMEPGGDFVAAWNSSDQDGAANGVFARLFSGTGAPQAVEFQVNNYTPNSQDLAAVGLDPDGDFVVTWESTGQDGDLEAILARRVNAAGVPQAAEFQVNTFTGGAQRVPAAAMNASGDFVIAWSSDTGQDGSSAGIFAQRFATLAVLDIDGNGSTAPLTDGLMVLRFLFGFTGATLVSGAIDPVACTRCNAPAIEGYLQTLI